MSGTQFLCGSLIVVAVALTGLAVLAVRWWWHALGYGKGGTPT